MPGTLKAVIFDMDGVLTDSEPLICQAAIAMFRELGCAAKPEDFLPFVGTGENRYLGGVAEKYGVRMDLMEAKRRTYEIYLTLVPEHLRAYPGAAELVRACKGKGLKIAVASSADWIKVEANLNKIGLPRSFWDAVVTAENVELRKPHPDLFLAAAKQMGAVPAACVVVEDAPSGIRAARAAGMRCVAVAQTFDASLLSEADVVLPSIAAVDPLSIGI